MVKNCRKRSYSLFCDIFCYFFTITSFIMTCSYVIYTEMLRCTQQMMFFSSKGDIIKNLYCPAICELQNNMDIFLDPKSFLTQNLFGPKNIFTPTIVLLNIFLDPIFKPKYCLTQKLLKPNFFTKYYFGPNIV